MISLVMAAACSGGLEGARATLPAIGSVIPACSYARLDAGTLASATLHGSPAVVALWSSTCSASRDAFGAIAALQAELAPRGVHVVLLADDRGLGSLTTMRTDFAALTVALAAGALKETFSQTRLGPWRRELGLPAFLVLDRASVVRYRQVGIEQSAGDRLIELRRQLDIVLREQP